jgi:hypothetical protein
MLSVKRSQNPTDGVDTDVRALHDSIRVLSEVVRHLSERIEVLEARAELNRHRDAIL